MNSLRFERLDTKTNGRHDYAVENEGRIVGYLEFCTWPGNCARERCAFTTRASYAWRLVVEEDFHEENRADGLKGLYDLDFPTTLVAAKERTAGLLAKYLEGTP